MQNDTFANRLKKAMSLNNITQSQLSAKTGLDKSLISNYLSGNYKAKQDKISILSNILNVSETWLMGYDVDITNGSSSSLSETEILFKKYKDILSKDDEDMIKFIIEKRKKEIDKELNKNESF